MTDYRAQFNNAFAAWQNSIATAAANPGLIDGISAAQSQLENVFNSWRSNVQDKQNALNAIVANETPMASLAALAAQVGEEKETLRQLREKQGTGSTQATSVNPKVVPSPYVNILNLRRNFRYGTKVNLIVASVIFGLLALGLIGFLIYKIVSDVSTGGSFITPSPILQSGSSRSGGRVRFHES